MYKTEKEIFNQYEALEKTYQLMKQKKEEIKGFINKNQNRKIIFTGCGSSYSLCKSAAVSFKNALGIESSAIAAGDLMVNFADYSRSIENSIIVAPSRSGSTSEVIIAVKKAKESFNTPCICISSICQSALAEIADLVIEIPWAFDESVCQTRTVTNLYMVNLMLEAFYSENELLEVEIWEAIKAGQGFMTKNTAELNRIVNNNWRSVVVLGDSVLEGIAEEGSLAFKEICQLQSNYYHVLDVRHGPMVLINRNTLVIMVCSPREHTYQAALIKDIIAKGAKVITVSSNKEINWGADLNIEVEAYRNYGVYGIPFIFIPQLLSYSKAVAMGINPDEPAGLDPWIKL